jgi:hypothetical protein
MEGRGGAAPWRNRRSEKKAGGGRHGLGFEGGKEVREAKVGNLNKNNPKFKQI